MKVRFCNWCPIPRRPSKAHHPTGHPHHLPLRTWAEVAGGLRAAGWRTYFHPAPGLPSWVWRSPDGVSGSDYRSIHPDSPPEAVVRAAYDAGLIGFLYLAKR
jgi:hypothetical protein